MFVLQAIIVWLTLVLLPIAVLLYLQLGFLPYHSEQITFAHRLAVLADVGLLLYFWPQMAAARWRDPAGREIRRHALWEALRPELPACLQSRKALASSGGRLAGRVAAEVLRTLAVAVAVLAALILLPLLIVVLLLPAGLRPGRRTRRFGKRLLRLVDKLKAGVVGAIGWLARMVVAGVALLAGYLTRRFWVLLAGLPAIFLACLVATIPDGAYERLSSAPFARIEWAALDGLIRNEEGRRLQDTVTCIDWASRFAPWIAAVVHEEWSTAADTPEKRYWGDANRLPKGLAATCPQIALFHLKGAPFHRNLTVRDRVLARSDVKPELAASIRSSLRHERSGSRETTTNDEALIHHQDHTFQLQPLDLSDRDLRYADFSRSSFPGARFFNARLQHAVFSESDLRAVDFSAATLTGAGLTSATLTGANLDSAMLSGANLTSTKLTGANLMGATLTGADLNFATLTGADLTNATLTGADLSYATLTGAELTGARLTGATLQRTILRATRLPNESNAQAAMLVVDPRLGRMTPTDLDQAEEALAKAELPEIMRKQVRERLQTLFDSASDTENFSPQDCIGSSRYCSDDPTAIVANARHRSRQLGALICPEEAARFNRDVSKSLVSRMQEEELEPDIRVTPWRIPAPPPAYTKPVAAAATEELRALATGRCADRLKDIIPDEFRRSAAPKEPQK